MKVTDLVGLLLLLFVTTTVDIVVVVVVVVVVFSTGSFIEAGMKTSIDDNKYETYIVILER